MNTRYVYRLSDAEGRVLYIGSTANIRRRLREHSTSKPWFAKVTTLEVEAFTPGYTAWGVETVLIRKAPGVHNASLPDAVKRGWQLRKARRDEAHASGRYCCEASCAQCKADRLARAS